MPDGEDHYRLFGRRAPDQFVEKLHRIRRVGQGRQPGMMQRGYEEAGRDADALGDVIVLVSSAVV